jgi:hypothetical protein
LVVYAAGGIGRAMNQQEMSKLLKVGEKEG